MPDGQLKSGLQLLCCGGELFSNLIYVLQKSNFLHIFFIAIMLLLGLIFWIIEVEKERRHESPHRTRKHSKSKFKKLEIENN